MAIAKVKEYLEKFGLEERVQEFEVSSATVELAAQALGTEPKRIAKSLTFVGREDPIMVVAAGDSKIDNAKFKQEFGFKPTMINFNDVEELIGHKIGGVCPFAIKENVKVYLDVSLKRFSTIFPACGSSNSAIELNILELEKTSRYVKWVDVCKIV